jgi:hypothetical protein
MIKLNVHEAKTHLSLLPEETETGRDDPPLPPKRPHRRNYPLPARRKNKRQIGLAKGKFKVEPKFFEPLPADIIDSFCGRGS